MPDPIIDDPSTVVDGNWYDAMAGEDAARIEVLKEFETAEDFYKQHQELSNRDWRSEMAGEDDKFKTEIERYESPAAFAQSWREQRQTISSGKMKDDLPAADADEEAVKAYRQANDIPLEVDGYLKDLPEGLVLGEDDVPIAESFMGALHSVHAPVSYAHALIGAYNEFAEESQAAQSELDVTQAKEATDSLRQSWQADYRVNINLVEAFLENTFGSDVKEQLLNGRFQDGRAFMNDAKVLEGLATAQRRLDPVTQIIDGGADPAKTMNDEIAELEKFMSEHRTAYNKDEAKQARLRQLYGIRLQHEAA